MKCVICDINEKQENRSDCKACEKKLFYSLHPFQAYIKRLFTDDRFDEPDPKFATKLSIPMARSGIPPLTREERRELEQERWDQAQHEYPSSTDDLRKFE